VSGEAEAAGERPASRSWKDHFSERAAGYARHRPQYPAALVDFLAGVAPARRLAWDAGCGSGQLSVSLAERFERVVATDACAKQIARAEPHSKVAYRCAKAEASGLPDGVVDLAAAAQAAHWFDLDAYYAEVRRVARSGAIIALVSYGWLRAGEDVDPILRRFHSHVLRPYWPPERAHVEDGYRSLPFRFEEVPAPDLEMQAEWTLEALLGYVTTWSAVRALEAAGAGEVLTAFRHDLTDAWGASPVRTIRWPLALRVGRV
jgi:SAM-dependent methyltransferase